MSLDDYRRKRQFTNTPEPKGGSVASAGDSKRAASHSNAPDQRRFVIQKHAARSLHYDLRIELNGVLKSWAVPKGPCLDPDVKRLAIHVEDHPIEYLEFEGIIPAGEYGGGTVMVWDIGTWSPVKGDPESAYQSGDFKFRLDGHKLQGGWMLVHTGKRKKGNQTQQWLLFKERDEAARSVDELDVLDEYPYSILSERTLEQIAADKDVAVWDQSDTKQSHAEMRRSLEKRQQKLSISAAPASDAALTKLLKKGRQREMPDKLRPMLPTATRRPPKTDRWVHEIKYDGYRMLTFIDGKSVRFVSRSGKDWTDKLPRLRSLIRQLPIDRAILDGEIVMMAADGTTSFQALQNRIGIGNDAELRYYVFDLTYCGDRDLRQLNVLQRKEILRRLIPTDSDQAAIQFSDHITGVGPLVMQQACKLGAEGIVCKRADSRYHEGRSDEWLKSKCLQSAEFLVAGYTDSTAARIGFGALVLGFRNDRQELCYAGRVGTGFSHQTLVDLKKTLDSIKQAKCPFDVFPDQEKGSHWVSLQLIVEVEFSGWTDNGLIRFPSYKGIRDDIAVKDVTHQSILRNADPASATAATTGDVAPESILPVEAAGLDQVNISHPDRIVYPEVGITKLGVATYYAQVVEWMLPHIIGRPLSMLRCPKGTDERCFFQKRAPAGLPAEVQRIEITTKVGPRPFIAVNDAVGLLSLVQFGVFEFHVWGALADQPEKPDRVVFDLDPDPSVPWKMVVAAAFEIRERLEALALISFVKTTGGKGLHVVVPLRRRHTWDDIRNFSELIGKQMAAASPGRFTMNSSKRARRGKIYIDSLRNRRGSTAIAPFSTRAHATASISMTVAWDELDILPSGNSYTVQNAIRRLVNLDEDPWREIANVNQSITKSAWKRLGAD